MHASLCSQYPSLAGNKRGGELCAKNRFTYFSLSAMPDATKSNLWHYNAKLKHFANQNRKAMTKAEACLWKYALGKRQMKGYQFRRQRPVLNYIADFMCKELMLIIEVDGVTHQWSEVADADIKRENELKEVGFSVIRFTDDEVLEQINQVIASVEAFIETREGILLTTTNPREGAV
jgi:very-short-patch-repair endonuclease